MNSVAPGVDVVEDVEAAAFFLLCNLTQKVFLKSKADFRMSSHVIP